MSEKSTKNIYEKLAAVRDKVGSIEKNGLNKFANYRYVDKDTLYDYFRAYFAAERLFVFSSTESAIRAESKNAKGEKINTSIVRKKHTIVDLDNPESSKVEVFSEGVGEDKTDKDIYQADTGAMKYFLIDNFFVSGGDSFPGDVEHDANNKNNGSNGKQPTPNLDKFYNLMKQNAAKLPEPFRADARAIVNKKQEITPEKLQELEAAIYEHVENFESAGA
jgi:hypothetical protein